MQRKRAVLILALFIMLAIPLVLGLTDQFESTSNISPTDWSSYAENPRKGSEQGTVSETREAE